MCTSTQVTHSDFRGRVSVQLSKVTEGLNGTTCPIPMLLTEVTRSLTLETQKKQNWRRSEHFGSALMQ